MKQFFAVGHVLRRAFADWTYTWTIFLVANTLWIFATATFILAPPALFGLFYIANEAANNRSPGVDDFFKGVRTYFVKSWQWGAVNLVAAVLFWTNFNFYPQFAGELAAPLLIITLLLLAAWLVTQFFTIPYLLEQEVKSLPVALRNGLFTALASPLFTLSLGLVVGLIVALCFWQPVLTMIGAGALVALIANHAVLERVEAFGLRTKSPVDDDHSTTV